jgi:hypothetical protein
MIRPLERTDLPAVAALAAEAAGRGATVPGLASYYKRTLLDEPWADPEIPSLVLTDDDGAIAAFQCSVVRRGTFDGKQIRIACAVSLVSRLDVRDRGAGALLLRAYLGGPQDLTITDRATEQVRQIWMLLGGRMAHLGCTDWVRVLRPWALVTDRIARAQAVREVTRPAAAGLDAVTRRIVRRRLAPPRPPAGRSEELTAASLLEHLPLVAGGVRMHLAYDEPFLAWLFAELEAVKARGTPVARLVRAADRRPLGWYVYYLKPGGVSHVLQIAAAERDVGDVLDHLFHDAWAGGAAAVRGRVEARLLAPVSQRHAHLTYVGGTLVHARDPEIVRAVAEGEVLLTRLDSEWWMGNEPALTGAP